MPKLHKFPAGMSLSDFKNQVKYVINDSLDSFGVAFVNESKLNLNDFNNMDKPLVQKDLDLVQKINLIITYDYDGTIGKNISVTVTLEG